MGNNGRVTKVEESTEASRTKGRRRSPATFVGFGLLLVGLVCLGWVAYQYFGTNIVSQRAFDDQREDLRTQWEQAPAEGESVPEPLPGDAIALLRIPDFGEDYEVPILAGTDLDTLAKGVGAYESATPPGEIGNFSIAGHRVTHGEPFAHLLELDVGAEVIVETRESIFTYVLDTAPRDLTVDEHANWVLDPVPGEPETEPTRELITLTTCQDLFHSPDRSVAFGHLESTTNKG